MLGCSTGRPASIDHATHAMLVAGGVRTVMAERRSSPLREGAGPTFGA